MLQMISRVNNVYIDNICPTLKQKEKSNNGEYNDLFVLIGE